MSSPELESDHYDVVVLGTGLAESIAAASLAKAGKTVLHLDPNEYYGGSQASLTLDELVAWSARHADTEISDLSSPSLHGHATTSALTPSLEADRRRYALSLFPAILPSRGALIDTLIASDVSRYVSFRMLDTTGIWEDGENEPDLASSRRVRRVPGSKEEIFKDKSIGLADKRKLMKFLMFAAGEFENDPILRGNEARPLHTFLEQSFSLPSHLATSITLAIAHGSSLDDPTLPALKRTRRYLKSIGRYGSGAFLVGQYGGAGEVAQGFCRACAVYGGTYVLGESARPTSIRLTEATGPSVEIQLPCHPRPVTASHLISVHEHLPSSVSPHTSGEQRHVAHCIAILDALPSILRRSSDAVENGDDDTAVVLFPPEGGSMVRALMMGEGTGSCPSGQFMLYLSTALDTRRDPAETLRPYLHRFSPNPAFESYRVSSDSSPAHTPLQNRSAASPALIVLKPYTGGESLTEGLDWEAEQGRAAYEAVMGTGEGVKGFFEKEGEEEAEGEMEAM